MPWSSSLYSSCRHRTFIAAWRSSRCYAVVSPARPPLIVIYSRASRNRRSSFDDQVI
uniref:Uncharacterized protein n=1 Tax=Zea mays TaxID=4577 RepID=B6SQ40_MAIZE|nr:hypothetical protein [Zea mays]